MARDSLGEFEQLVLLAILRLSDEAYGVSIVHEIEARTGRAVSRAAVYIALRRLRQKSLVSSRLADATPERGGRAKRYFSVRPAAINQLRESRTALTRMWHGLSAILDKQ